jgi:hypothetical protein
VTALVKVSGSSSESEETSTSEQQSLKTVVAFGAFPETCLEIENRLLESQRFGIVDGGFGANVVAGFVVLLDGVALRTSV